MAALETGMAPRLGGACEPFRPRPSRCALAYDESWNSLTVWSLFTIVWLADSLYKRVDLRITRCTLSNPTLFVQRSSYFATA